MRHAPRWAWSVVLLAAAVGARADDKPKNPPKDDSPKTAAEQYQALEKEFPGRWLKSDEATNRTSVLVRPARYNQGTVLIERSITAFHPH